MKTLPLIALAFSILCASAVFADDPLVEIEGSAANQQRNDAGFEIAEAGEVTLSVACATNDTAGSPRFSFFLFRVEDDGSLTELEDYRVVRTAPMRRTRATIALPPGNYRATVVAIRMDYQVRVEHKKD